MSTSPLSDRDLTVLEFARYRWPWHSAGRRDQAVWDYLGMSWARYSQVLATVLASPAAADYDAELVKSLTATRARRRRRQRMDARRRGFDLDADRPPTP